jgi:hypothetical protein
MQLLFEPLSYTVCPDDVNATFLLHVAFKGIWQVSVELDQKPQIGAGEHQMYSS